MKVTKDQINRISALAKINTDNDPKLSDDIIRLLGSFSTIQNVDLSNIEPMVLPPQNLLRKQKDTPGKTLDRDKLLRQAPKSKGKFFLVPKIMGEKK